MTLNTQVSADASISNSDLGPFSLTTFQSLLKRQYATCTYCVRTWPTGGLVPDVYTTYQACDWPIPTSTIKCTDAGGTFHSTPTPTRPGYSVVVPSATTTSSDVFTLSSSALYSFPAVLGPVLALAVVILTLLCVLCTVLYFWRKAKRALKAELRIRKLPVNPGSGGNPQRAAGGPQAQPLQAASQHQPPGN